MGSRASRCAVLRAAAVMGLISFATPLRANPTGGAVVSGSASIATTPGVVTVNQLTSKAVIDWQTFSIGAGELTKFVQPSSASATLNRVLGGQMSIIDGSLGSNGQVYLLNGNGILIGPGGVVDTSGFVASTRDISDADFASGDLHFTGTGDGGVANLGSVSALGGDVIFIGKTVGNQGVITAASGHVGLAAADDVMISQSGMEHVFVRSTANPAAASGQTGVDNSGTIIAEAAELRAANGNIYALATNNSGIIRATGVANEGGRIWLVAEGNLGVTENTGTLVARGADGRGGQIETSGGQVVAHGTIDAGNGGAWLIDPTDIVINAAAAATIETSLNAGTTVTEDSSTGTGGSGNITVSSPITWTGTGTLNLDAYLNVIISSAITGTNGSLSVESATGGSGSISATAAVSVMNFTMAGGSWVQNAASLPGFAATNFTIAGGSFLRAAGGSGTTAAPYQITDAYGLQGVGSSAALLTDAWRVSAPIDASGTSGWNSGAGFVPIGDFTGVFNGNGDAISGLFINRPTSANVGLFAQVGSAASILDVVMTGASVTGLSSVGALAGTNAGSIETSSVAGTVSGTNAASSLDIGGMVGANSGSIGSSFSAVTVTGYGDTGGFVGSNTAMLVSDYSTGATSSFLNASASGSDIGGLVGLNTGGTLILSYATGNVTATDTADVGGLVGASTGSSALINQGQERGGTIQGYSQVGGLVGSNASSSSVEGGKVIDGAGTVGVTGSVDVGGLVGNNSASVIDSSVVSASGSILGRDGLSSAANIGGLVGNNTGTVSDSFALIAVGEASGTTDAQFVGGFAGINSGAGAVSGVYATGNVTAPGATDVGGLVGGNSGTLGVQSNATGNVTGATNVGGLVGENLGTLGTQSFAMGTVTGTTFVGGLIGVNTTSTTVSVVYAEGSVSGTSQVGGLIGSNVAGNFSLSTASGQVSGTGTQVGGLMGHNGGTLTLDNASGNVSAAGASDVGGLVGDNSGSILSGTPGSASSASGNVTGGSAVGGLVGNNTGSGVIGDGLAYVAALADYTSATGSVIGLSLVGGLVGDNAGTVQQGSASGAVSGSSAATTAFGGLVGQNEATGTITTSFSSSVVHANGTASTNSTAPDSDVGGLVGSNLGAVARSYATGAVVGDSNTGGLVGLSDAGGAVVQTSYSTGAVTGLVDTGGLVGNNESGTVTENYSTSVTSGSSNVGGLVGLDGGSVSESYSTGSASGTANVGGLIGQIAAGTLAQSYATGAVTGGTAIGGLVGTNGGTISGSYWDGTTTGQGGTGVGSGSAAGAVELTGATAYASASYTGFGTAGPVAGAATNVVGITNGSVVWYMLEGATRPFLAWEAPVNGPVVGGSYVVYTAHQLQLVSVDLAGSYVLGQNIDLSATQQASGLWNPATGFVPIGQDNTAPFAGSFSGGGYGISNLSISLPGSSFVGLFGASNGSLSGISLGGSVTGSSDVGLLVGENLASGTVSGARLSGSVAGSALAGGLAGENEGVISGAAVNVAVTGSSAVGGIAGSNDSGATIRDSYSIGAVNGTGTQLQIGGLAGENDGTITVSYETGAVTANSASTDVGGAIGFNQGSGNVSQVYSTGATTGGTSVGGVIGEEAGALTQSYSTGSVGGEAQAGGLAGTLDSAGSITRSYASGAVTSVDPTTAGALVGEALAGGLYSNLFWDHANAAGAVGMDNTTGQGPVTDLHGDTIDSATAAYAGLDSSGTPGFATGFKSSALIYGSSDGVWRIEKGSEFPLLTSLSTQVSGVAYSDEAHTTPAAGATVTLNGTSQLSSTTTDGSGNFAFLFAADAGLFDYLPHISKTLRVSDAAANADSIAAKLYNGNGVPDLLADLAPADTWGATVRVVSSGLDNALLEGAGSAFISSGGANAFGGTNIAVSENFEIGAVAGSYSITGDITADGDFMVDAPSAVPSTFDHPVTLDSTAAGSTFSVSAQISSGASNRAIIVESAGNFVNGVGTSAFSTPSGSWIVYSQNPPGSGQSLEDDTDGLNELHLYGTNPTQTPAYLLNPGLDYQIYSFTPTLTLTAAASGSATTNLQYGDPTPALQYLTSGLLPGDTVTPGQTFNQVLSNQPGESTPYGQFSPQGTYPVSFITSTLPSSLIGYNLVFASGSIVVGQNTSSVVDITVSGSQNFGYIGGGPTFVYSATGAVAGDPNFNPTFSTTVTKYQNVNWSGGVVVPYMNTISLNASSVSNYTNVFTTIDNGFTVNPAALTISATATSIYGETIVTTPSFTGTGGAPAGTIYDNSGTGATVAISSLGYTFTNPAITTASHVGNYAIALAGTSGETTSGIGDLANYNVTITPGTYAITRRQLVIDGTQDQGHIYDATPGPTTFGSTDYSVGATAYGTGLVNGDQVSGLMGRVSNTDANVGHYDYTVGTLGTETSAGVASSDYTLVYNNEGFGLDITALPITISPLKGATKVYGAADPSYTFANGFYGVTSGSLQGADAFTTTGQLARAAGENVNGETTYLFTSLGTVTIADAGTNEMANYAITFSNPSMLGMTITPAPLTVTAIGMTKTYDGTAYTGGNGVTYSGFQFSDSATSGALGGTLAYGGTSQNALNAGSYVITPEGYTAANYMIGYVSATLLINPASLTVTSDPQSKVYGGVDPTLTYTPSGTLFGADVATGYAGIISGVSLTTTTGAAATAGTHPISFEAGGGGTALNYTITDVPGVLTVSKAPLTVTADNQDKVYGGADPTLTYSVTGLQYTDGAGVVSGVNLATVTGAAATAGTHPITATGGTASNYTVTDDPGTLTVSPAALTVTADNQTTTYGTNPTLTYTVAGLQYTDLASVVTGVSLATTTGSAAVVGTYPITATGGAAANYTLTDFPGTLTVDKAPLTVTADDQSKTYGGADPTLTYTPSGTLYYGDSYSVISGVALSTTSGAAATAGTHPIDATGGTAANYAITDIDGTLNVAKANLTVTATNSAATTYGTAPVVTYVVGGTLYYGDTASVVTGVTLLSSYGPDPVVGTYSATPYGGTAANYNITDIGVTNLTVTPAPLYATGDNQSKVYGGADPTLTFTLSGTLYYGDTYGVVSGVSVSGVTGAAATAGTHPIVVTGGIAANYYVVDVNGTLTVSPATLTVTADSKSKVYGGADPALTYTPSGTLYYGDSYSVISGVDLSAPTGAAAAAGTHTIAASGGSSANYTIVDMDGLLTVSKADLTVTADSQSKTYGGADPTLTYTVAGLVYGDPSSVVSGVTLDTTTGFAATAGMHPITTAGGVAANYTVTDVNGTLTVNPASLTISADPETKFAGATYTFTGGEYTETGLLGTDTVSGVTLTSPGSPPTAAPGTYTITAGNAVGSGLSNYTITYLTAPFTVIPSVFSQLQISWTTRDEVNQLIGAMFDSAYGERQFYDLQVPGTIHRVAPTDLDGIGTGSSLIDVRLGLESIFSLDRFQSFRH